MPMGRWLDDRSFGAPRPFGRGRALPHGPEEARAPEPRLPSCCLIGLRQGSGGSRPIRVTVPFCNPIARVKLQPLFLPFVQLLCSI